MEEPSPPPLELKPWYYQEWFMFPTLVFWPLWAILIIRSPWHNGLISGAVAWAMLIVGGYLIIWPQLIQSGRLNDFTIVLILPGLLLTVITQVHWMRYRPVLERIVAIVRSERPQVVVGYDDHEWYPHPDHLRVHELSVPLFEAAAG